MLALLHNLKNACSCVAVTNLSMINLYGLFRQNKINQHVNITFIYIYFHSDYDFEIHTSIIRSIIHRTIT